MREDRSLAAFQSAHEHLTGGVGAGGRFFRAIDRSLILERAAGAYLFDVDGNRYIDYHTSSGAALLGHNHPAVAAALRKALEMGFFCNYETEHHEALGKAICECIPCAEKVRFTNSGTEATMAALRLARAVTGRAKIIKFEGHFHGMHELAFFNCHTESAKAGPGGELEVIPDSPGIPTSLGSEVIVLPFNDPAVFSSCVERRGEEIAAVIMEPIMYNAGCVLPDRDFAHLVRELTSRAGIVLIVDEVLSGFRMGLGGGQEYLGITPDLCTLAKALGGSGIPIAALAGKESVMAGLGPVGGTAVSGTYSGHLIEVLAALATLAVLRTPGFFDRLNALSDRLYRGLQELLTRYRLPAVVQGVGARFAIYFGLEEGPIYDYRDVVRGYDFDLNRRFVAEAFRRGLYFHDYGNRRSPTHHGLCSAHTEADVEETLNRCEDILKNLAAAK
jgi:glutamate-1-semialdehyde 2,1-aminomutase